MVSDFIIEGHRYLKDVATEAAGSYLETKKGYFNNDMLIAQVKPRV